jgi:hypothetical protein
MSERRFQRAKNARFAAFSNRSSPVRRDRIPNSMMSDPAPAEPAIYVLTRAYETIQTGEQHTGFDTFSFRNAIPEISLKNVS